MKVRHIRSMRDRALASVEGDEFFYRTEVTNTNAVPIKIVWFDGFYNHEGLWNANNVTNGVLREQNFLAWYQDGDRPDLAFDDGWLLPGRTAVCDPNWNLGAGGFYRSKWASIAVDATGQSYFDEAEVSEDVVTFHQGGGDAGDA